MSFSLSEYTKIDVGWGFAPDPTGGAYSAPHTDPVGFKGADSRQEGNRGEGRRRTREGEEKRGREGKGEVGGIASRCLDDGANTDINDAMLQLAQLQIGTGPPIG